MCTVITQAARRAPDLLIFRISTMASSRFSTRPVLCYNSIGGGCSAILYIIGANIGDTNGRANRAMVGPLSGRNQVGSLRV